ncbi:MAG: dockerin type I repeat-containing protein [Oscillospiraceae bacterium]|nr:dockerin type I repeat-containing protein [Oscillospiraceae bacterium]
MKKFTKQISALLALAAVGSVTVVHASTLGNGIAEPGNYDYQPDSYEDTPMAGVAPYTPTVGTFVETTPEQTTTTSIGTWVETTPEQETTTTRMTTLAGAVGPGEYDAIPGDVYYDMVVDMTDLTTLSLWLLGDVSYGSVHDWSAGDVNGDGDINIADLAQLKYILMNPE